MVSEEIVLGMYNWVSGWGLLGHHVSNFKIYSFTAYMTQYKLKPVRLWLTMGIQSKQMANNVTFTNKAELNI